MFVAMCLGRTAEFGSMLKTRARMSFGFPGRCWHNLADKDGVHKSSAWNMWPRGIKRNLFGETDLIPSILH